MSHIRAKLNLDTATDANEFVIKVNSDGSTDKWMLENRERTSRVSARSILGVLYAVYEWGGEIYLVNDSQEETPFPSFVDHFRA